MSVNKIRGGHAPVRIGATIRTRKGLLLVSIVIIIRRNTRSVALKTIITTERAPQTIHKIDQDRTMIEQGLPVVAGMRPPTIILKDALHLNRSNTNRGIGQLTTPRISRIGQQARTIVNRLRKCRARLLR